jgi:hypothetical protein
MEAGADGFIRKPFRPEEVFGELARVCGVRYVEQGEDEAARSVTGSPGLLPERVRALPAATLAQLRNSTIIGDKERLLGLLAALGPEHGPVADGLRLLAEDYQYQALLDLFGEG